MTVAFEGLYWGPLFMESPIYPCRVPERPHFTDAWVSRACRDCLFEAGTCLWERSYLRPALILWQFLVVFSYVPLLPVHGEPRG